MRYLKKFESRDMSRQTPVFTKVEIGDGFEISFNEKLTSFTKDDILDFHDDFEIISSAYGINLVSEIDPEEGENQYEIGVSSNIWLEIVFFDDDEDLKETMDSFVDSVKRKYNWELPTTYSYSFNFSKNVNGKEFAVINLVFTKQKETKKSIVESNKDIEIVKNLFTDKYSKEEKISTLLRLESESKLKEIISSTHQDFVQGGELMILKLIKKLNWI
jgi:hypothetical protein